MKKTAFSYISAALLLAFTAVCFTSCTWEIVSREDVANDTDTYVWVPVAFHVGNRDIVVEQVPVK